MNVQGARVERHAGRAIMSRFHAGFSIGTVGSALLGAALIAIGVPVTVHLTVVAVVVAVTVLLVTSTATATTTSPSPTPRTAAATCRMSTTAPGRSCCFPDR